MHLTQNNNPIKRNISKTLTFVSPTTTKNTTHKNTFSSITAPMADVSKISTNILHAKKNVTTPIASIANINIYYDPVTNTSFLQNTSKNFAIKVNGNPDSITLLQNGDVVVGSNLNVVGNINMIDGNFTGDIMASNANLLGDIVSTNSYVTNNFTIDGITTTKNIYANGDVRIDGFLEYVRGINTDNIIVTNRFKTESVETSLVGSPNDLDITVGINRSVNIPNVRYNVNWSNNNIIDPPAIKSTKIFVVSQNVILRADETCNGIEIIIYNNNVSGIIIIRDNISIINRVPFKCGIKLVYVSLINRWIKI